MSLAIVVLLLVILPYLETMFHVPYQRLDQLCPTMEKKLQTRILNFWLHVNVIILVGTTYFLFLRFVHMKLLQARSEYFQHVFLPMISQGHHQDAVVGGRS